MCEANTALLKKDGGLRPIACGDVRRRLTAKCVCKNFAKTFQDALDPFQFGVAISGGTEILVHTARLLYEKARDREDFFLLKFDFRNAFNCISRQVFLDEVKGKLPSLYPFVVQCYSAPSVLKFGDRVLWSQCGVQQGDPLGPLLFCLAIHPLLLKIQAECPGLVSNSWYLDDGVVAGSEVDVTRALHLIQSEGPARGMFLNAAKSEVWNPRGIVPAALSHFKALEPEGFKLLGSPIGDAAFCQRFFAKRMAKFREVWTNTRKLDHLQIQALLLRYCASFCKVVHLFRSVPPHLLSEQLSQFDAEFREAMESITGKVSDFTWAFMGLGCKKGGLGLRPSRLHALGGYLSSFHGASLWIKARFPAIPAADIDGRVNALSAAWSRTFGDLPERIVQSELSARTDQKLLPLLTSSPACPPANWVASIQSPSSASFWKCLPSRWTGTYIDNACFRVLISLRYRLAQMYESPCPATGCTATLDPFGDHALCCKKGGEPTIRHNRLSQRLAIEFGKAVAGVSLEARLLLQKSDERPADIFLTAWRGGAHALDVTVPHVITKRTPASAQGLHAMEHAIDRKKAKYFARCQEAGLNFSVLAFDTLGATHPDTVSFLRGMFKDAKSRELCPDWKSIPQAWYRVIVPLQVDVARQILARCVAPDLEALQTPVFVPPAAAGATITLEFEAPPALAPLAAFFSCRSTLP